MFLSSGFSLIFFFSIKYSATSVNRSFFLYLSRELPGTDLGQILGGQTIQDLNCCWILFLFLLDFFFFSLHQRFRERKGDLGQFLGAAPIVDLNCRFPQMKLPSQCSNFQLRPFVAGTSFETGSVNNDRGWRSPPPPAPVRQMWN